MIVEKIYGITMGPKNQSFFFQIVAARRVYVVEFWKDETEDLFELFFVYLTQLNIKYYLQPNKDCLNTSLRALTLLLACIILGIFNEATAWIYCLVCTFQISLTVFLSYFNNPFYRLVETYNFTCACIREVIAVATPH